MTGAYIGLVLVNYRTDERLIACLRSLSILDGIDGLRVCVVDNSEQPQRLETLRRSLDMAWPFPANLVLFNAESNLGYAAGNNAGYRQLFKRFGPPRVLWILNPDCLVTTLDVEALLKLPGGSLMVGETTEMNNYGSSLNRLSPWTGRMKPVFRQSGNVEDLIYPKGHCLLIRHDDWIQAEGFSPDYFLYCEELDLALTLLESSPGLKSEVCPAVSVRHEGRASDQGVSAKGLVMLEHSTRSRLVLFRRHRRLQRYLIPLILSRLVYASAHAARGDLKAARAVLVGLIGGVTASVDRKRSIGA